MNGQEPKQFLLIQHIPMFLYAVKAFQSVITDIEIIIVVPSHYLDEAKMLLQQYLPKAKNIRFCKGGDKRFHSVANGLKQLRDNQPGDLVAIHDAARPLVSSELIQHAFDLAEEKGNAVPCISVNDSLRMVEDQNNKALDRNQIVAVQTPQVFEISSLTSAYAQTYQPSFTDSASIMESTGHKIHLFEGEKSNFKITTPLDFEFASLILNTRYYIN